MKIRQYNSNYNPSYTARCPEIRDLQWVNHKVNSYEHISPMHIKKEIVDLAVRNGILAEGENIHSMRNIRPTTPKKEKFIGFYKLYKRLIEKITSIRHEWQTEPMDELKVADKVMHQFKEDKYVNCGEQAFLAGCIAKINLAKNVCTVSLAKDGKKLNHVVCIINRDGSKFDGTIKPSETIIIDPWYQKTEFAVNLIKEYKTTLKNFLMLEDEDKIGFLKESIQPINLSHMDIYILRIKYPELKFPYRGRDFMQKKERTL